MMMLSSSSLSRGASLSMTPRLAAAGPRRGVIAAVSTLLPPLLSPLPPTPPHSSSSSRPQRRSRCASSRRASVTARSSRSDGYGNMGVTARWCLDARFGSKAEAAALLTEWATKIAPRALAEAGKLGGGSAVPSVRVLSGAVGASESRLEVEVSGLSSFAALEALWESLPREEHRHWQERLARHVVDGSTRWEVFHELGVVVGRSESGQDEAARASSAPPLSSPPPPTTTTTAAAEKAPSSSSSPLLVVSGEEAAAILQADTAAAMSAIEKSGNGGALSAANGGGLSPSSSASLPPSSSAGRGRPRSLERATAARARAAAAEASKGQQQRPSSSSSSSPPLPPITISSILGGAAKSSGSSSNGSGSSSSGGSSGSSSSFGEGGGGDFDLDRLDTSKLVPGQRLPDGSVVATDWKGDVMIIRPGDRGVAGL